MFASVALASDQQMHVFAMEITAFRTDQDVEDALRVTFGIEKIVGSAQVLDSLAIPITSA